MECRTKDELEQHLSDIRRLATSPGLTSAEKESATRAERFAMGLAEGTRCVWSRRQTLSVRHAVVVGFAAIRVRCHLFCAKRADSLLGKASG